MSIPEHLLSTPSILVEKHHISPTHPLWASFDLLSLASKNLYNHCLYLVRNHYFEINSSTPCGSFSLNSFCLGTKSKTVIDKKTGKKTQKEFKRWIFSQSELYQKIKHSPEFRTVEHCEIGFSINTKILKQTLKQVEQDFSNFFKAQTAYFKNPASFAGQPQLPNYKKTGVKGRNVCTIPIEALSF